MPTQKIDPKVIFASNAPTIDKPPVFGDKTKGWDVARANDGRPEIKQMNKVQQDTDLKILWLNENSVTPYDASIDYPDGAVAIKDGSFKQLVSGAWVEFLDDFANKDEVKRGIANRYDSSLTYNSGERVVLTNDDIVKSTVNGNTNDPNVDMTGWVKVNSASQIFDASGLSQQEVNNALSQLVITPEYFGAVSGEADSSNALNNAIIFCSANNYVLDGRGKSYNANSLVLKDNTHIKRISINSNLYDTMNSVLTTDYGMLAPLKNVTLDTVYIDGKRELHTGVTATMDGGRCAVLIRRPIDGFRIINSKLNNAVTDGLMLFPVDWAITESDWFSFVKNVYIVNCNFTQNGRWGISADSVDGFKMTGGSCSGNGLDVQGGGDYSTGKSARLDNGKHYGGGIDFEEYHGFAHSKDIHISSVDLLENAGPGLWFMRTGVLIKSSNSIYITDCNIDSGLQNEIAPNVSLHFGFYSANNPRIAYRDINVDGCNLNSGKLQIFGCDSTNITGLFNVNSCELKDSVVMSDKNYNFNLLDSYSNFYERSYALRDKDALFVGDSNRESVINIHNENTVGKSSSINVFDNGAERFGLRFTKLSDGYELSITNSQNPMLTFGKYGSIIPNNDNIVQVGESSYRISKFYGHAINISSLGVFSDNNAAKSGGLVAGDFYRTSTGQVMVVF